MISTQFFGGIEENLNRLVASGILFPGCKNSDKEGFNLFGNLLKVKKMKRLEKVTPEDSVVEIRIYDLISGSLPFARKKKCRIFAAFSKDASHDAYKDAKYQVRKWYQINGYAAAADQPDIGAMVVGSAASWPEGMVPDANDLPFDGVRFHVLWAPDASSGKGVKTATSGDQETGAVIFRALGEPFEYRRNRVVEYLKKAFSEQESLLTGNIYIEEIAKKTNVSENDVSNICNDLQGEGLLTICKRKSASGSKASVTYVVNKKPTWLKKTVSKHQGAWYTKHGFYSAVSASTAGYLLYLLFDGLKEFLSDFVSGNTALLIPAAVILVVIGAGFLVVKFILGNK